MNLAQRAMAMLKRLSVDGYDRHTLEVVLHDAIHARIIQATCVYGLPTWVYAARDNLIMTMEEMNIPVGDANAILRAADQCGDMVKEYLSAMTQETSIKETA